MATIDPLDLDAQREHIAACLRNSAEYHMCGGCGRPAEPEGPRHFQNCSLEHRVHCFAVIKALRAALEALPSFPHNGMCQFRPSYSQLGPRACTCFVGKAQAALALVTGGGDDK